jgi:hypothetical protein
MARAIINLACLIGALCVAWIFDAVGSTGWAEALVNDKVWSVPLGWVSWHALISWFFQFLLFLALGVAITWVVRSTRRLVWAGAFGIMFSLIQFALSRHGFAENAGFAAYFWMYGQYLVPPAGALFGSWVALWLSARGSAESPPTRTFDVKR